jgi:hypothetical protein
MNERKINDDLVIKPFFCVVDKYEIFMRNEQEKDAHICSNGNGLGSVLKIQTEPTRRLFLYFIRDDKNHLILVLTRFSSFKQLLSKPLFLL